MRTNTLPRSSRLVAKADYDFVFAKPTKFADRSFTLLARAKASNTPARLGLAVAKKVAKSAVVRNRIKRQIRESFRHQPLCEIDLVIIARPAAARQTNDALAVSLASLFGSVQNRFASSS